MAGPRAEARSGDGGQVRCVRTRLTVGTMEKRPPVIVHPVSPTGGRRVTIDGTILGIAYSPADLAQFLRRAGLEPAEMAVDDPERIQWRGGDINTWSDEKR